MNWRHRLVVAGLVIGLCHQATPELRADPRLLSAGRVIPSEGYADQPYVVKADDGAWVCVLTTGKGVEGAPGQHIIALRSADQGRTWSKPVAVEPSGGPEASYAVLLKVPGGRIYAFYNHNTDRVAEVKREDKGVFKRVDSLGHYVFKYSDDHGKTWSERRYEVPVREFECDRKNVYGGKLKLFWNVGRPLILGDAALLTLHKVGAMGDGFFAQSEGAFLRSKNLLTERDPAKITFETLPDGDVGLRTPKGGGRVAEEQSVTRLSDGSLYCVYRTIDGWPACAYSRDGARTWTEPEYATYSPGGRRIKHPRAANFVWRCSNGKFLYWFHNHGGRFVGELGAAGKGGRSPYDDRNPAWLLAGREVVTPRGRRIEWSQPEILLYDDDPYIRMSYPDLIEDGGKFFITQTQKAVGRVHEVPAPLLDDLFNQFDRRAIAKAGLALDLHGKLPAEAKMPTLPAFNRRDLKSEDHRALDLRAGFSLDFWLELRSLDTAGPLLDSRDTSGKGILVTATDRGTVRVTLNDGRQEAGWECDRGVLAAGKPQHVVVTVDGGPKVITFVVNGVLGDGGDERQFGWGRFSPTLRTPNGAETARIGKPVRALRVYTRALRTSEAVGNYRAGPPPADAPGPPARKHTNLERLAPARLAAVQADVRRLKAGRLSLPPLPGLNDYRCILHAHAEDSAHTGGTLPEMLADAKKAGVHAILLSDHFRPPRDFIDGRWRGLKEGVLFIPGSEAKGFLIHPEKSILGRMGVEGRDFIDTVTAGSGLIFLSHIEERRDHPLDGLTGLEIYNRHFDAKQDTLSLVALGLKLTDPKQAAELQEAVRRYPDELLAFQCDYPKLYLEKWDEGTKRRRLTGVAANDCHHNQVFLVKMVDGQTVLVGTNVDEDRKMRKVTAALRPGIKEMTKGRNPGDVLVRLDVDPYFRAFRNVCTHVLAPKLDEPAVRAALKAGRAYVAHDWMGDATGFRFVALGPDGKQVAILGDEVKVAEGLRLAAKLPLPALVRLLRHGKEVARSEGKAEFAFAVKEPGAYRLEAWLDLDGEWRPWIYANPIYVR